MRRAAASAWLLGAAFAGFTAARLMAQTLPSQPSSSFPPDLEAKLAAVQDFGFDIGVPAFYALVEYLKRDPAALERSVAIVVDDWRQLSERPADFRGRLVTVEGVVGVNRSYQLLQAPHLGTVWQLELHRRDQPIACSVALTNDASDLPLGATIRVTGVFLMMRQYDDSRGQARRAALLVSTGPTSVSQAAPMRDLSAGPDWKWLAAALGVGLVAVWIILRRATSRTTRDVRTLHADRPAPMNLSDDLRAWAEEDAPPAPSLSTDHETQARPVGDRSHMGSHERRAESP